MDGVADATVNPPEHHPCRVGKGVWQGIRHAWIGRGWNGVME
jgi:hypothetical protein